MKDKRTLEQDLDLKFELENSKKERKLNKEANKNEDYEKLSRNAVGKLMGLDDDENEDHTVTNPIVDYEDNTEEFEVDSESLVYKSHTRHFVDDYAFKDEYDKPTYEELSKRPGYESKDIVQIVLEYNAEKTPQ